MPFGVIVGLGLLLGFAAWGILLMRSKVREKSTEASSYYESNTGTYGDGHWVRVTLAETAGLPR
jgi:hypothetical protein